MFLSLHRNERNEDLFEIWRKEGQNYRLLRRISTEDRTAYTELWMVFHFGGEPFLLVPLRYPGTGYFHTNYLYHINGRSKFLDDVTIREASHEFPLAPDDSVLKGEEVRFSDDSISFSFGIWKENACNACAYDEVAGNYVVERDAGGGWVMRPGEMKRTGNSVR